MRILVSNDDGFHAEGIQVLAKELRKIADVVIAVSYTHLTLPTIA